jgi:hypothetical protein
MNVKVEILQVHSHDDVWQLGPMFVLKNPDGNLAPLVAKHLPKATNVTAYRATVSKFAVVKEEEGPIVTCIGCKPAEIAARRGVAQICQNVPPYGVNDSMTTIFAETEALPTVPFTSVKDAVAAATTSVPSNHGLWMFEIDTSATGSPNTPLAFEKHSGEHVFCFAVVPNEADRAGSAASK